MSTLTQALQEIRKRVEENGTEKQKEKLRSMSISQLDEMTHIAQSMGASSAISMFLPEK